MGSAKIFTRLKELEPALICKADTGKEPQSDRCGRCNRRKRNQDKEQQADSLNPSDKDLDMIIFSGNSSLDSWELSVRKWKICKNIKLLETAPKGRIFNGSGNRYHLRHCGPGTAAMFINWLQNKALKIPRKMMETNIHKVELRYDLAFLWCLAEELQIPDLQNATVDEILKMKEDGEFIPWCALKQIWDITSYESPLRQLYIDGLIWGKKFAEWENHSKVFTHEMLLQIATCYRKALSLAPEPMKQKEYYYAGVKGQKTV